MICLKDKILWVKELHYITWKVHLTVQLSANSRHFYFFRKTLKYDFSPFGPPRDGPTAFCSYLYGSISPPASHTHIFSSDDWQFIVLLPCWQWWWWAVNNDWHSKTWQHFQPLCCLKLTEYHILDSSIILKKVPYRFKTYKYSSSHFLCVRYTITARSFIWAFKKIYLFVCFGSLLKRCPAIQQPFLSLQAGLLDSD